MEYNLIPLAEPIYKTLHILRLYFFYLLGEHPFSIFHVDNLFHILRRDSYNNDSDFITCFNFILKLVNSLYCINDPFRRFSSQIARWTATRMVRMQKRHGGEMWSVHFFYKRLRKGCRAVPTHHCFQCTYKCTYEWSLLPRKAWW